MANAANPLLIATLLIEPNPEVSMREPMRAPVAAFSTSTPDTPATHSERVAASNATISASGGWTSSAAGPWVNVHTLLKLSSPAANAGRDRKTPARAAVRVDLFMRDAPVMGG